MSKGPTGSSSKNIRANISIPLILLLVFLTLFDYNAARSTPGTQRATEALWKKRCKDGWKGVNRFPQTEKECGKGLNSGGNKDVCKMIK
jgi:hypothetical protein